MSPIAALLPIVNNQQRFIGLIPNYSESSEQLNFCLLKLLDKAHFFEVLPGVQLFLPIHDLAAISADFVEFISGKNIILCVDEDICASQETQNHLNNLLYKGIGIFVEHFHSKSALLWNETKSLLVDCDTGIPSQMQTWLFRLQSHPHLATNVHSLSQQKIAADVGFSLFSGNFAFSPTSTNSSADVSARTRLLKLLGLVSRDADAKELEALFKQDPALSFMLLKIVSSAAFAQTTSISNFNQAINLLGRRQLQRWLQLLLYASQIGHAAALNPLMLRAAFRASMMEKLCQHFGGNRDDQDCAFMVGMFSLLDLLFATPMWEILKPLRLSEEVRLALCDRKGLLGLHLQLVEQSDRGGGEKLVTSLEQCQVNAELFYASLIHAYAWVSQVCQDI